MTIDPRFRVRAAVGLALLAVAVLGGCVAPQRQTAVARTSDAVQDVATRLVGAFSSKAQSGRDPAFFDVRLHTVRIWTARTDGPWLYVEQAMATALEKPYRQRVYQLVDRGDGSVESVVFELPTPADWTGAWREPTRFDSLSPESLARREGCSIVLWRDGEVWRGATNDRDCPSSLRGACYATSEVTLRADGLNSWDRGFDANGSQVWGATTGAYEFRR
jgi:hypothetical protein